MLRFWAGFATASVLWGLSAVLLTGGWFEWELVPPAAETVADGGTDEVTEPGRRRRRWRRRRGRRRRRRTASRAEDLSGFATTGDDLGGPDPRFLNADEAGGEEQLTGSTIQQTMDGAFGRVRKCLVLAAGDSPVRGRLTFGLRIEPNGSVSRVNLSGPRAVSTGEAGTCLRNVARAVRFPSFNGPPMVARYPITLD